jgi:hypothetical protein
MRRHEFGRRLVVRKNVVYLAAQLRLPAELSIASYSVLRVGRYSVMMAEHYFL